MSVSSHPSRASRGSRGGGGGVYRKVAHTSEVDDTLFGERHSVMTRKASKGDTVSRRKLLALTGKRSLASGGSGAPAVVVTTSDIARMKAAATIKTADDLKREAAAAKAAADARASKARARKEHILALEEQRKKSMPLTKLQAEKKAEDEAVLKRATALRSEALDDVKTLKSYGEYAKTVTIRNKQVAEKKEREAREREAERIRDLEMEIQRLETVKMYRDRELAQREGLVAARKHIEIQMAEREKERERAAAELRKQQEEVKREAERAKEAEAAEFRARQEKKARQRAEVLAANEAAIEAKRLAKQRELEEDAKIAAYLKEEDARKAAEERVAAELKAQKELEFAKLRAKQEKMADDRAELDARRARRAFEAGQREIRRKETEAARKAKERQEELIQARIEQQEEAEIRKALEIQREREEYERNRAVREEWLAKEAAAEETVRARNHQHKSSLIASIEERGAERKAARKAELESGRHHHVELAANLEEVRRVRDRKVQELVEAGVPPIYTVELSRYDPADLISKDYKLGGR